MQANSKSTACILSCINSQVQLGKTDGKTYRNLYLGELFAAQGNLKTFQLPIKSNDAHQHQTTIKTKLNHVHILDVKTRSVTETLAVETCNAITRSKFFNTLKILTKLQKKYVVIYHEIHTNPPSFNVGCNICQKVFK